MHAKMSTTEAQHGKASFAIMLTICDYEINSDMERGML
jgi:hypothetical protein